MGMAVGGGGRKGEARPQMNVTPLVDVVLVLLIIFMVVTPLLTKQLWLNLPKKDENAQPTPPPSEENKNVVVSVTKDGAIKINQDVVPKEELQARLARIMAARAEKVIYFDAEDGAPYVAAVEAMDLSRMGGATTIAIMTDKIAR